MVERGKWKGERGEGGWQLAPRYSMICVYKQTEREDSTYHRHVEYKSFRVPPSLGAYTYTHTPNTYTYV